MMLNVLFDLLFESEDGFRIELCYVCYRLDQTVIFVMLFNFTETSMLKLEGGGVVTMRR